MRDLSPDVYRRQMHETRSDEPGRYLVECYWPGVTESELATVARRVEAAAQRLSREGSEVTYLTGLLVPEDEVALCLFEAGSSANVEEACRQGGLPFDRILSVAVISPEGDVVDPRGSRRRN
jgi:hypothetical protein